MILLQMALAMGRFLLTSLEWMILLQMALAMGRFLLTSKNFARILHK